MGVLEGTLYNASADVYSFAICTWHMVMRREPFAGINMMQLVPRIVQGARPAIEGAAIEYKDLLEACWTEDFQKRPPFYDICRLLKGAPPKTPASGGGGGKSSSQHRHRRRGTMGDEEE